MTGMIIPQWVTGQWANVLLIEDPGTFRSILNQITYAIRDVVSTQWSVVRATYMQYQ